MLRHTSGLWSNLNFRKLWAGQTASLLGSQVTTLTLQLIAALVLDASPREVGVLTAANLLPALVAGPVAGLWADRSRRRPMLIVASVGRAILLGAVAAVALTTGIRIEHLWAVAFLTGLLTNVFDVAQASLLPSLVQRNQFVDGNSKLEVSRAGTLIVGPGLAGLLVQLLSVPFAFVAITLSFLTSALLVMRIQVLEHISVIEKSKQRFWLEASEGARVIFGTPVLSTMAVSLILFNFFAGVIGVIYVLYVTRELGISPAVLGFVYAVGSASFPFGAAISARISQRFGVGRAIVWGAGISDIAFLLLPLAGGSPAVAMGMLVVSRLIASLAGPITSINQLSLRQAITPSDLLGRVNGAMLAINLGSLAVGTLFGGVLGDAVGIRSALIVGALGIQLGFVRLYFSPLRSIRNLPGAAAIPAPFH